MKKLIVFAFAILVIGFGAGIGLIPLSAEEPVACPHPEDYWYKVCGCGGMGFHNMKACCCETGTVSLCAGRCECKPDYSHNCDVPE